MPRLPLRPVLLLGSIALGGCAAAPEDPRAKSTTAYMISSPQADFFKYGPAQAFGPDYTLKQGDRVTLVKKEFGYSQVSLANGTVGYVSVEDLAPAPAPPVTRPSAAIASSARAGSSGRRRSSNVAPVSSMPLFDINDVPLPLPDAEAKPKPSTKHP